MIQPNDIIRWEIRLDLSDNPMYGRSRVLYSEDQLDGKSPAEIIELAKRTQTGYADNDVFVLANQYTCEDNVRRHFAITSHYIWHQWLTDAQVAAGLAYIGKEV